MTTITLRERIDELIAQHGTLRATARVLMTDCGYLHRLRSGEKTEPGDPLLRRMGLREVTRYERVSSTPAQEAERRRWRVSV
jgi:siroheme synthase (precorrin-2 oxidase/ferrochelatase)